jgi:dTMP kinase
MDKNGFIIAFEGGDGCGKGRHIKAVAERLIALGLDIVLTREPGATKAGEIIREWLLNNKELSSDPTTKLSPEAQMLLFFADRAETIKKIVAPAVEAGKIVITDRSFFSTVYEIYGGQLGERYEVLYYQLVEAIVGEYIPDFVFLMDIDPLLARKRIKERGEELTTYEMEKLAYHRRVREGYKILIPVTMGEGSYVIINTEPPFEEVNTEVQRIINQILTEQLGLTV